MRIATIRQKLHRFIETAEEKKVKAIYTLFEDEITQDEWEYTDEFKAELDRRFSYYKHGGKMVSAKDADIYEMDKRFKELESGKVMGLKLEDLTARARQANKTRKRKNYEPLMQK